MTQPDPTTLQWLVDQSMLEQARHLARAYSGQGALWRYPYAAARPRDAAALASVWFTAYPPAVMTGDGASVLQTLGDDALWAAFAHIGIQAVHTGPMKLSGGVDGTTYTPSVDGNFDRIGLTIDPALGTADEFVAMSAAAARHGAIVIDDIVPGHTGKGPDFRLAELAYADYPGIYHMVEIAAEDWELLPPVRDGEDAANLAPAMVDELQRRGYIVGRLSRVIFYEPGIKETNWSATGVVTGVDGRARRWVYLHYFKAGQPTLNWLDPSCAAPRLVMGDALHSLNTLGARVLRLDANGFLGVEPRPGNLAWSEGHPLSVTANQLIAGMVRKVGGFTFQELNLAVDDIAAMGHGAADLSYDFITRPAYHHALVTGDTAFLRLMLRTVHQFGIDPASLVHALQNHDELTLELVHFWTLHKDDTYELWGRTWTGSELRAEIRSVMYERLTGEQAPYNRRFVTNGVACTTATVVAVALGIHDVTQLTEAEIARIRQVHLLLAMYNALQPGVFALSGWDLVGALTLPAEAVADLMGDGDTRWINRGAYDLMDAAPAAGMSAAGLPCAQALYGSLAAQLQQPDSFAHQLRRLIEMRNRYRLYAARQVEIPGVTSPGLLVMVHQLPDDQGLQLTALNFGAEPVTETVAVAAAVPGALVDLLTAQDAGRVATAGRVPVCLDPFSGQALLLRPG